MTKAEVQNKCAKVYKHKMKFDLIRVENGDTIKFVYNFKIYIKHCPQ